MLNDPSKAFNCLLHELLVTQLNAALRLVKNYLTNCSQRTKINSDFSSQRRHFFLTPSIPLIECSVVVSKRRRFFLMSSIPLIEILQNRFFQLYNCNNHTAINVDMDSQDNLNMTKVSNFTENRRNRKIHTKSDDQILETAPKRASSVMDMNVLLSQNKHLLFGITYPTGRFYKDNWLVNHKKQAALMKSSKNASTVLLGDSIVAGFLRYHNIWYKFFDENTINCGIGGDKIQNVL